MTSHETRFLFAGILVGIAIAGAAGFALYRLTTTETAVPETYSPSSDAAASPAAVQLAVDEQAKIGLQTAEIRRESLYAEILAPARAGTPDTVRAEIFASDAPRIQVGATVDIISDASPGVTLRGTVRAIESRSVGIQLQPSGTRLMPGTLMRAAIRVPLGTNVLAVPRSAVIDTGSRKLVYVARADGIFESRAIQVGSPGKDRYPVVEGLVEGDKVVTNGAFLVDSQTRLTGGMTGLFGGSKSFSEPAGTTVAESQSAYKITFRIDPNPPRGGRENTVRVAVIDPSGKPVSDAEVRLTIIMPAMPAMRMPEMRSGSDLKWSGSEYTGPIAVSMAGPWNVIVEAHRAGGVLGTYRTRFDAN